MKYTAMRLAGRPEFWLALLLAWASASALRSWNTPWRLDALTEWVRWASGIGLALALGGLLTRARQAGWLLVIVAGALAVWGLRQAALGLTQITGPYRDHQLYGSALLTLLPLALAFSVRSRSRPQAWAAQSIALAVAVSLAFSQTRSAWIGGGAGVLVFAWLWLWTARPARRVLLLPVLLGLGVMGACAVLVETTEMQKPLALRMQTLQAFSADTSWQGRLIAWRGARRMAAQSPVFGVGLGRYPDRQRAFSHVGRALSSAQRPSLSEQAHDLYLQTAAEIGWPAVGLYGLALLSVWGRGYVLLRQARGGPVGSRTVLIIATLALVAAHLVDALANPAWQFGEVSELFWAALGVGLSAINRPENAWDLFAPRLRLARVAAAGMAAVALAAPRLPWGLLPPVEAYAGGTGLTLTSVSLAPAAARVVLRGFSATVPFSAIGHFRVTQSGETAPDEAVTWNGAVANGVRGTQFAAQGAWGPPVGMTGFSADPAQRNLLTLDAREGAKTGHEVAVRVRCFIKDDQNEQGRIVESRPALVTCFP